MNWPEWTTDDGRIRLIQADCLEVLPTLSGIDAVVTDPPYGISHVSNRPKAMRDTPINGDSDTSLRDCVLEELCDVPSIVFGTWRRARPKRLRGVLIWDKGGAVGMGDLSFPWKPSFEEIYISGDGFSGTRGGAVLRHVVNAQACGGVNGDGWLHPHEKPIELLEELIEKCPGETILDTFAGSCTTAIACMRTGRRFIGIEKERKYWEIGIERVKKELGRTVLFDRPPARQAELIA